MKHLQHLFLAHALPPAHSVTTAHVEPVAHTVTAARTLIAALAIIAALALLMPVRAGGPLHFTVNNCANDAQLRDDLAQLQSGEGGSITFNCGTATITLASQLPEITKEVIVDGGNKITLSGHDATRLFLVLETGKLTLKNIILEKGYSEDNNGGAINNRGSLTLDKATIRNSHTPNSGGAIATNKGVEIINSTLANNTAGSGGAIYADDTGSSLPVKLTNIKFLDNSAAGTKKGGAIHSLSPLDIKNGEFARNKAGSGGAIYVESSSGISTIAETYLHDNETTGQDPYGKGGALATVLDSPVYILKSTFQKNTAQSGGAVFVDYFAKMTVTDSTFVENRAANGGGIQNVGRATLNGVTLAGNIASLSGGGIDNSHGLFLTNVTLSGNQAMYGGGLKNQEEEVGATLTNVTVSGNTGASTSAGGILNTGDFSQMYLKNVIVGKGAAGSNCLFEKAPANSEFNLSNDGTCSFGAGRDSVNLRLGPLANNGGLTKTHLPQTGSPAIDGGTGSGAPGTDQRGVLRPQRAAFDVGAVEVEPGTPTPTRTATRAATPTRTPTKTLTPTATRTVQACTSKPAKPVLLKPRNAQAAKGPTVRLDWNDTLCATRYQVFVRLGSPGGVKIARKGGLTQSQFTTNTLVQGQTYAWRVTAINASGKTKSDWWTFRVK